MHVFPGPVKHNCLRAHCPPLVAATLFLFVLRFGMCAWWQGWAATLW